MRFAFLSPLILSGFAALAAPIAMPLAARAAGGSIDPDPRAPSLGDLLDREEAQREKARHEKERLARLSLEAPATNEPAAPQPGARAAAIIPAPKGAVRQIYPPSGQSAVTVLVPGARPGPR